MPPKQLAQYYREGFGGERQARGQIVNARVNLAALERLLDLGQIRSFLDVGAGYGFLIEAIRDRHGVEVLGLEPSVEEASFARNHLGLDVRDCLLADADLQVASFDVVAAFEVIEHITDPIGFVRELSEYVRPGGTLVIKTDNFDSQLVHNMGAAWPKWIPHTHVSHFSPDSLVRCIESVGGLTVTSQLSYTPWENHVKAWLMRGRSRRPPQQTYDFAAALEAESSADYPLFRLRRLAARPWFLLTRRSNLGGTLMFVAARKNATRSAADPRSPGERH